VSSVKADVSRVRGLEVSGHVIAIAPLQRIGHEGVAITLTLVRWIHANQWHVPMRLRRTLLNSRAVARSQVRTSYTANNHRLCARGLERARRFRRQPLRLRLRAACHWREILKPADLTTDDLYFERRSLFVKQGLAEEEQ
jgi:hypothetical protein